MQIIKIQITKQNLYNPPPIQPQEHLLKVLYVKISVIQLPRLIAWPIIVQEFHARWSRWAPQGHSAGETRLLGGRAEFKHYLIYTLKATTKKEYNISLKQVPYSLSKMITNRFLHCGFYLFIYFNFRRLATGKMRFLPSPNMKFTA